MLHTDVSLTLFKDGTQVKTEDGADLLGQGSTTLNSTVMANCDSMATYTCVAVNRVGQRQANVTLNVLCKSKMLDISFLFVFFI